MPARATGMHDGSSRETIDAFKAVLDASPAAATSPRRAGSSQRPAELQGSAVAADTPSVSTAAEELLTADGDAIRGATLDALYQGVVVTDPSLPDNPIVYANDAFLALTGYEHDEIVGFNCRFLQGPGTDGDTVEVLRRALREQRPFFGELLNYRKDGTPFWNALSVVPLRDADGELTHFVASQTDVTELKELQLRAEQQGRLELLGAFAGGIAHDFNNVLVATLGYAEILAQKLDDPELRRYADQVVAAAESGRRLTRQLLAFGKGGTNAERLDLGVVATQVTTLAQRLVGSGVVLELPTLPESPVDVVASRSQLEQIVLNLVVNARDAVGERGRISIGVEPHGGAAVLTVADDGCGMPEEVRARILEPFFTTKGAGGTGLGLATVAAIVDTLDGRIECESAPGAGTTFRIALPRAS